MNSLIGSWKTSTAGVAAALFMVAQSYKPGMTWKQWAAAVLPAAATALVGILAKDHGGSAPGQ